MAFAAGQSWTYRTPRGYETSRLVIGAIASLGGHRKIVLAAAIHAPRRHAEGHFETVTIPFLPMTEAAFRASVISLEGTDAEIPDTFVDELEAWKNDPKGLTTFTVGFDGFLDHLITDQMADMAGLSAA